MADVISSAQLRTGDVLLYGDHGLLARAIRLFDGTEVHHAGLYVGDGHVVEALGHGVVRQGLRESVAGREYVLVRRLPEAPDDMEPVRAVAQRYLDDGNRYAYEQILLLAFLCLTRKVKVTPVLRGLVRRVLDGAASLLTRLAAAGREPMICSEVVYRAYDEAHPDAGDVYSLRVEGVTLFTESARGGLPGVAVAAAAQPVGRGIHPESLLAWAAAPASRVWSGMGEAPRVVSRAGTAEGAEAAGTGDFATRESAADLDEQIERYLAEVRSGGEEAETVRGFAAEDETSDADVRAAIDRFAVAWYAASQPTRGLAESVPVPPAFRSLLRTAADFVTPGDLLRTQSLLTPGRLEGGS